MCRAIRPTIASSALKGKTSAASTPIRGQKATRREAGGGEWASAGARVRNMPGARSRFIHGTGHYNAPVRWRRVARPELLIPLLAIVLRVIAGPRVIDAAYILFLYAPNLIAGGGVPIARWRGFWRRGSGPWRRCR